MPVIKCNGLASDGSACLSTRLCRAHILPSAFAKRIMGSHKKNKLLSLSAVSDTQHGVYDTEILCAVCDRHLGNAYDKYAVENSYRSDDYLEQVPGNDLGLNDLLVLKNVDGDRLALFVLSVLWRASLSRRVKLVDLGHHANEAKKVLFGARRLERALPNFQVYIEKLRTRLPLSTGGFWTSPVRVADGDAWTFALAGFRFTAKFHSRPFADEHKPFILNGSGNPLCRIVRFEDGREHAALRDIAVANLLRRSRSQTVKQ